MTTAKDIIAKAQQLLDEIDKMGVGLEGGGPTEHQTGSFGQVHPDEHVCEGENKTLPHCIDSEKPFRRNPKAMLAEPDGVQKNDVETNQPGFGTTDETVVEDNYYMPTTLRNEDNCTYKGKRCKAKERVRQTTKEIYNTGDLAMSSLGGTK